MVSSSPQDEKQKNLKYKLKEPVLLFTYHSSYVPFGWRRIRPVVLFGVLQKWVNVCFASSLLSLKSPSLSMTGVHEKNFIARKIAVSYMNGQCSLQFELLFTVTCFKWLTEDLLKNDSPSKVRLSNSAAPKSARSRNAWTKVVKQKTFFTFSRMRRQKSPLLERVRWTKSRAVIGYSSKQDRAFLLSRDYPSCPARKISP